MAMLVLGRVMMVNHHVIYFRVGFFGIVGGVGSCLVGIVRCVCSVIRDESRLEVETFPVK